MMQADGMTAMTITEINSPNINEGNATNVSFVDFATGAAPEPFIFTK